MSADDFRIATEDPKRQLEVASTVINNAIASGLVSTPVEEIQFYAAVPEKDDQKGNEKALKALRDLPTTSFADNTQASSFKWTSESIKLMLSLRFEKEDDFNRPFTKKIKIWDGIAAAMLEEGYNVAGIHCSSKYRNLKSTFTGICLRLKKTGEGIENEGDEGTQETPNWEFYSLFKESIGKKACIDPHDSLLGSTFTQPLKNAAPSGSVSCEGKEKGVESKGKSLSFLKAKKTRAKKEPELTVKQYLHKKTERDIVRSDKKVENEIKRLKLEEERLKIERERTAAINNLAAAIAAAVKNPSPAQQ